MKKTFSVGDRVKLANGKRELVIVEVYGSRVNARYVHNQQMIAYRDMSEFVPYDDEQENNKGDFSMKGDLFKTKDETNPRFGTGLTLDSQGNYVLEMKDGSGVATFKKEDLVHVMPFTYAVKYSTNDSEYQYLGKEGSVQVGDMLITLDSNHKNGGISIGEVVAVDTKSKKAKSYFKGAKLLTVPLVEE